MKTTLGNYLTQANKDFPIDAETFDYIQQNLALLSVLGNIAGDRAVLSGCEPEQNGTRRKEGYVFVRTKDFPDGEILYWEGGAIASGMYLKKENVSVSAQGYAFPQAYVVRSLAPGIGEENYRWEEFATIRPVSELDAYNRKQDAEIAELSPLPLGIVQMWAGNVAKIPLDKYRLCDGSALTVEEYLYSADKLADGANEQVSILAAAAKKYNDARPDRRSACPICGDGSSWATTPRIRITTPSQKRVEKRRTS